MVNIITANTFDVKKLNIGQAKTVRYSNKSMPLSYDGQPLLVQTPVFEESKVQVFEKQTSEDRDAMVMYFAIKYEDEAEFVNQIIQPMNTEITNHVSKHGKELFGGKNVKPSSLPDLFASPLNEPENYNASFKSNVLINEAKTPVKCEFYDQEARKMSYDDFKSAVDSGTMRFSGRAIVEFTHAYVQPSKRFGYKSCVRVVQLLAKPEDAKPIDGAKLSSAGSEGASNAPKELGPCFV